ncbi:MAG: hypothetical protein D6820_09575 [Lentisphaerae bacterium]|nr:MAG: hypothetical protein D6820_09575 [Lentisphaerota bacterium]
MIMPHARTTGYSLLFLGLTTLCQAQIRMGLKTDRPKYLPYEPVKVTVLIENNSGNTLYFNDRFPGAMIHVILVSEHGAPVKEFPHVRRAQGGGPINFARGLVLPTGGRKQLTFTVNRYFDMAQEGIYTLQVELIHPRLPSAYRSRELDIQVIRGIPVLKRDIGVHTPGNQEIQTRTVTLLKFYEGHFAEYALRIEDKKMVYNIIRLGRCSQSDEPQMEVDARAHIHLLIQQEAKSFSYVIVKPDGQIQQTAIYRVREKDEIPSLIRDPEIGRVMVRGGRLELPGEETQEELPEYTGAPIPESNPKN